MLVVMGAAAEQTVLVEITRRLMRDFPAISRAEVDPAVRHGYARCESSPIRDFVPLLAENHARCALGQQCPAVAV